MRVDGFITIARLTFLEARRRRLVHAALAGGLVMLLVFATALYLVHKHPAQQLSLLQLRLQTQLAALAGFYAVNLLAVAVAIMLPVDALSGEIASGVMQTLASKPVRRAEILLTKWFVFWLMIGAYIAMLVAGVVGSMRLITGFSQPNAVAAAALLILAGDRAAQCRHCRRGAPQHRDERIGRFFILFGCSRRRVDRADCGRGRQFGSALRRHGHQFGESHRCPVAPGAEFAGATRPVTGSDDTVSAFFGTQPGHGVVVRRFRRLRAGRRGALVQ